MWDDEAVLLPRTTSTAVQRAGGLARAAAARPGAIDDPDECRSALLRRADPAPAAPTTATVARARRVRDRARRSRAMERDLPLLGVCRGMQLMNLARGGTLIEHLPDVVGHEDHRLVPGAFGDHDVRLADGSLAARAAGELAHADEVAPPSGRGRDRRRASR